jgi:hypothetical protein
LSDPIWITTIISVACVACYALHLSASRDERATVRLVRDECAGFARRCSAAEDRTREHERASSERDADIEQRVHRIEMIESRKALGR